MREHRSPTLIPGGTLSTDRSLIYLRLSKWVVPEEDSNFNLITL